MRDRRLGRVARGHALQGVRDEVPRPPLRVGAGLLLDLAHHPRHLVADELLGALEHVPASPPRR